MYIYIWFYSYNIYIYIYIYFFFSKYISRLTIILYLFFFYIQQTTSFLPQEKTPLFVGARWHAFIVGSSNQPVDDIRPLHFVSFIQSQHFYPLHVINSEYITRIIYDFTRARNCNCNLDWLNIYVSQILQNNNTFENILSLLPYLILLLILGFVLLS
jgi:hypothetical protein